MDIPTYLLGLPKDLNSGLKHRLLTGSPWSGSRGSMEALKVK